MRDYIIYIIMVFWIVGSVMESNYLRSQTRELRVDVALLQQQMIVLLVGQGYQLQEKK